MENVIILVHDESEGKKDELLSVCRVRPDIFSTTSGHLALFAADEHDQWLVFDRPMGVLDQDGFFVRLLDLENGIVREVTRSHLGAALSYGFIKPAF